MKTLLIALVPMLLSVPTIAHAETVSNPVAVSAAGLDLTTAGGASTLLQRARDAAERACRIDDKWDRLSNDYRRCRTDVVAAVVAKVDVPTVTALYKGEPAPALVTAAR
jgi:UrcA family protein